MSRSIHLLPSFFFLLPPFSRIGNSILEKAKNVVDKRPWRNAVRTFLCTIEYDCEIIDNLEWLHRRSWLHFIQRFDLYQEFCLRCLLTPNIYKYRSMFSFLPSFFFFNFYSRSKSQFICIHSIRCVCKIWNEKKSDFHCVAIYKLFYNVFVSKNRKLWLTIWFNLFLYVESKITLHMFVQAEMKFIIELIFYFFFFCDNIYLFIISYFHFFILICLEFYHSYINFLIQMLPVKYRRECIYA